MLETNRVQRKRKKRALVYDAAISLFDRQGFEKTTVDEIAEAAGISRRSFFRYFASKDDLLADTIVDYGRSLVNAVVACPRRYSHVQVIEAAVRAGAIYTAGHTQLRKVMRIAERSGAARQAHQSRLMM